MIVLCSILIAVTNKLQKLLAQTIIDESDANKINSLGWIAVYILLIFNLLSFSITIIDYVYIFITYYKNKNLQASANNN